MRGQVAEDREYDHRADQEPFAAEHIGERSERQRAKRRAEQARRADLAELRHRQTDLMRDRGRGIADRLGVEAVERRDQHAQDENADLKFCDWMAVDEIESVNFGGSRIC